MERTSVTRWKTDQVDASNQKEVSASLQTVYNTLNLFVEKGLLRQFVLTEGRVVFDKNTEDHHLFIDENSGRIYDVPWDAVKVEDLTDLEGFEVRKYQVVMRGKKS